jgi:threonine dehydratase
VTENAMTKGTVSQNRTKGPVRLTTIVECPRLAKRLGVQLFIASETLQYTGSFKFRAAYQVASTVSQDLLIAASSGNFGQALAYACSLLKKSCIIVMPVTSAKVKVDAVRECGGRVEFVDVRTKNRAERVEELAVEYPTAYVASSYDDPLVIEGNSSLGREVGLLGCKPDIVVAPVGGGGLISGVIAGLEQTKAQIRVVGAEPLAANDAARSLRAGELISDNHESATIADGARVLGLGKYPWQIIRRSLREIVEVPEEKIVEAMRLLYELANLKVEPTGALSLAAVMTQPEVFRDYSVCCIASGGNVDPDVYAKILSA